MSMIVYVLRYLKRKYPTITQKICNLLIIKDQLDVNCDLTSNSQKRVLISYKSMVGVDLKRIKHASWFHLNQIIYYFIKNNYAVDICDNDDISAIDRLKERHYDVILGFGSVYKAICKNTDAQYKICFITENNPEIVSIRYAERISYFRERHPRVNHKKAYARCGFFDIEQFEMSTHGILMNSQFNSQSFIPYFGESLYLINSNTATFKGFDCRHQLTISDIKKSRKNYLWMGSFGFIHKGLDILLDVFGELPEYVLNCYGVDNRESSLFNELKKTNTYNKGFIDVQSDSFVEEIALKHNFVLMPSCSEGMSTAVAICMSFGIVPIVTKECGFESSNSIFELKDYHKETIRAAINALEELSDDEIYQMRCDCQQYAINNFSIECFTDRFNKIMDLILK